MVFQMDSSQCWRSSMRLPDMLIKVVAKERALSPFILSHGTQMSLSGFNSRKIMVKKKTEPEIYSMLFGFLISSWRESVKTLIGLLCAQANAQVLLTATEPNSRNSTWSMNLKVKETKPLRHKLYGIRLLQVKSKLVLHTCSSKMLLMLNQTNKTLEQSRAPTSAAKSLNTPPKMKSLFATWHLSAFQNSSTMMAPTTSKSFIK